MSQEIQQHQASVSSQPQSGGATVPMWLIILTFVLLYGGAVYFDTISGWFEPRVYGPYKSVAELEPYQPVAEGGLFNQGKVVYGKTCVACHQATGMGTPGQFPPLGGSEWVNEADSGRMIRAVLNGLQGPIKVEGHDFNNAMVPWNSLSDEDIAAVITYVRGNAEWGNKASAVTPERVKAVREKIKSHPGNFTPDELLKIAPAE